MTLKTQNNSLETANFLGGSKRKFAVFRASNIT